MLQQREQTHQARVAERVRLDGLLLRAQDQHSRQVTALGSATIHLLAKEADSRAARWEIFLIKILSRVF